MLSSIMSTSSASPREEIDIVIADDELDHREVLALLVEEVALEIKLRIKIVLLGSPEEVRAYFRREEAKRIRWFISDRQFADSSSTGEDLLRESITLPVCRYRHMVSAIGDKSELVQRLKAAGINGLIEKPIDGAAFSELARRILTRLNDQPTKDDVDEFEEIGRRSTFQSAIPLGS